GEVARATERNDHPRPPRGLGWGGAPASYQRGSAVRLARKRSETFARPSRCAPWPWHPTCQSSSVEALARPQLQRRRNRRGRALGGFVFWRFVAMGCDAHHLGVLLALKTRFVGALSNASTGIFSVSAKSVVEPPATHSLRSTVVKSALLWTNRRRTSVGPTFST